MYAGETKNERSRMSAYAAHGSHLSVEIDLAPSKDGWTLYYRAIACSSKKEAKELQDRLLAVWNYDWNIISNCDDD